MKQLHSVRGHSPRIGNDVYVAPNATIVGDVEVGERASVWFNVTIRGDVMPIKIGREANIQDNSVLHGTFGKHACTVGERATVGHLVVLHGCTIGRECLIGMNTTIMDGAVIGERSLVGAGSLVTEGTIVPPRSLVFGRPARVVRELTTAELEKLSHSADNYLLYKTWYEETAT